jgi:hypothetical protein
MSSRTAAIKVDADIAQAWESASASKRKQLQEQIRKWFEVGAETKKKVPHLSRKESELLLRISQDLAPQERRRMEELTDKMEFDSITDEEHAELLRLSDETERLAVERLKAVIELAKYRKISVDELMRQLGMEPGKYAR